MRSVLKFTHFTNHGYSLFAVLGKEVIIGVLSVATLQHATASNQSNEALQAAEKGLSRLMEAVDSLEKITPAATSNVDVKSLRTKCFEAMNDDLNTPIVISHLFDGAKMINNIIAGNNTISADDLKDLKEVFHTFCFDILGLKEEIGSSDGREAAYGKVVDMLLEQRVKAKANKDWATSDLIRNELTALGFEIKDTKDGFEWKLNK